MATVEDGPPRTARGSDPASPYLARRGPKPGARSSFQQQQRALSREAILAAANELLNAKAFDDIAIEEILARAPCSRATFYRHFRSKFELALALYEQVIASAIPLFDALVEVERDPARAAEWIERLIDHYRTSGRASFLILQLGVTDPRFHQRLGADRHRLIDHLAGALPVFGRAVGSSHGARVARAEADLVLMLLDRLCVEIAVHGALPDQALYVGLVAKKLIGFLCGEAAIDKTDCIIDNRTD